MNSNLMSSLCVFAFVSSITPGPNNLMLLSSGMNFGFRRTIPHMAGIGVGFTLMIFLMGIGLIEVFDAFPKSLIIMRIFSAVYLVYLAYKIAMSAPASDRTQNVSATPMTFVQAALFQWVNPKAWTMALAAISLYSPNRDLSSIAMITAVFGIINLPCVSLWALLGEKLSRFLSDARIWRAANFTMAFLLLGSLYLTLR